MDQATERYTITRATGTHGDVFAAVGLADLLWSVSSLAAIRIVETELGFEVSAPVPDSESQIPPAAGYPFLKVNERTAVPREVDDFVDYKIEKAKSDWRRQLLQGKNKKSISPELQEALQQDKLRDDWRLLQVLNTLQGDETSNRICGLIARMKPDEFARSIEQGLASIKSFEPSGLEWGANSVQLFTPNAAKGYARLKPDSTDRNDKTKEQWTDSFLEWLRYRGYFVAACPFFLGQRAENIRLLCPVPRNIQIGVFREVVFDLRPIRTFGAAKLDSLAVLKLAELLIRRSEEFNDSSTAPLPGNKLFGKSPADVISGISITQYQSLGNAKAVSAMSTLALPGWFTLNGSADSSAFLNILDEHQRVIRSLHDDYSDEIGLLLDYRRFLERRGQHAIQTLIDFMGRYGAFLIRTREQGRPVAQFTTTNLENLLMRSPGDLNVLLTDAGFRAVAAAIRAATVNAQAQKAMNRPDYREIRYDLIPELRRKSSLPGNSPFVETLSDFISKYNVENARRRELGKPAPRNVTTEEFESVVRLVDSHGAAIVGPMLCAYGSCRVPSGDDNGTAEPQVEENPED